MDGDHVAPGIVVLTLPEAAVNAVIVHDSGEALVIDPGLLPASTTRVSEAVEELGARVVGVVVTHPHWDHAFGLAAFPGEPTYAHPLAIEELGERGEEQLTRLLDGLSGGPEAQAIAALDIVVPNHPVAAPTTLAVGSLEVELEPVGHAHSAGDLVVHVRASSVSIVGDLVEVGEDPQSEDGDLETWLAALDRLEQTAEPLLVPGHGIPTGHERIAHHRDLFRRELGR